MDCKQTRELLAAYLDGELSSAEKAGVERHLAECRECRLELESLREAQKAIRSALIAGASSQEPPKLAWEQLKPSLEVYRPSMLFLFRQRKWRIVATVIAAALLIAILVWVLGLWR